MAIFKDLLKLPAKQEQLKVFSVLVFFVFTWALYRMAWYLPSWLYYLNLGHIFVIIAYTLSYCLFESIVVMAFLLILSLLLPAKYLKERFGTQGSTLAAMLGMSAVLAQRKIGAIYDLDPRWFPIMPIAILALILGLVFGSYAFFSRFKQPAQWVNALAERMTVFAFIYMPLSLIGVTIVLIRNIF